MKRESDIIISLIARATFAESYIRNRKTAFSIRPQTNVFIFNRESRGKNLGANLNHERARARALTTHARSHARTLGSLGAHVRIFNDSRRISEGD